MILGEEKEVDKYKVSIPLFLHCGAGKLTFIPRSTNSTEGLRILKTI